MAQSQKRGTLLMLGNSSSLLACILVAIGICGALCRRNLFAIILSFYLSHLGIILFLANISTMQGNIKGVSLALIFLLLFSMQITMFGGLLVFVYRHRGTLQIDELRQLRG